MFNSPHLHVLGMNHGSELDNARIVVLLNPSRKPNPALPEKPRHRGPRQRLQGEPSTFRRKLQSNIEQYYCTERKPMGQPDSDSRYKASKVYTIAEAFLRILLSFRVLLLLSSWGCVVQSAVHRFCSLQGPY